MLDEQLVITTYLDKKVVEVKMNRPRSLNAMSIPLGTALLDTLRAVEADPAVKIVILCSEGRAFCAGADLKEMGDGLTKEQHFSKLMDLQEIGRIMRNSGKIFIGAIQGYAVGIGFELVLACDQVVVADDAILRFPEVEIDATVTGGGHKLLLEAVGSIFKAKELLFRGTKVVGADAVALSIANEAVPLENLQDAARALANELKEKPVSLTFAKHLLHEASDSRMEDLFSKEVVTALYSASVGERTKKATEKIEK